LARLVRGRVEAALPERYGDLVELCARLRSEVRAKLPDVQARRRFWEESLEGAPAELVFSGELAAGERAFRDALERAAAGSTEPTAGDVYLIGVGPNDPELVSFRAQRLMQRAEWVLYANDVAPTIVDLSRRDAQRLAFSGALDRAAAELLPRMAAAVRAGQRVCVLALGDAFRDAAGRRFREQVGELGAVCQVVPGIAARDGNE
jgi:uroporphyrin-III C-methyltransferase/precorrin-2 dehydrogenase/sirohydrochlorin ferrochelatase